MSKTHKNKTFATLFAALFGAIGLHRFYLHGIRDAWAWLHMCSLPVSAWMFFFGNGKVAMFSAVPLIVSMLTGFIEALAIGLTTDGQWDRVHNRGSGWQSNSRWPLALVLVLTVGIGATTLIASIARLSDLVLTGGAYG